jgi:hypothetical protein
MNKMDDTKKASCFDKLQQCFNKIKRCKSKDKGKTYEVKEGESDNQEESPAVEVDIDKSLCIFTKENKCRSSMKSI